MQESTSLLASSGGKVDADYLQRSTPRQAVWNILKPFLGAGIFAFPWALLKAGLVTGVFTIVLLAGLALYTMNLMLQARLLIVKARGTTILSYEDLGEAVAGRRGRLFVQVSTVSAMIGVCGAYLVFVAELLGGSTGLVPSVSHFTIVVTAVLLLTPALWLEHLSGLSRVSAAGTAWLVISVLVVYIHGLFLTPVWHPPTGALWVFEYRTFPLAFGTVAFMYTSHTTTFPVALDMRDPSLFPVLLRRVVAAVTVSNVLFAVFGLLVYGSMTAGIVILNVMPVTGFTSVLVRIGLSVDLLFTFPLAFWPVVAVIETALGIAPPVKGTDDNDFAAAAVDAAGTAIPFYRRHIVQRRVFRSGLAMIAGLIALATPSFSDLASLLGAIFMSGLAYIMPPYCYLKACDIAGEPADRRVKARLYATMVFGVITLILGSTLSIIAMVQDSQSQQ